MYDSTGCVDAEEMEDDDAFDIFATFFGGFGTGGFDDDMDAEEQAMFEEFMRMVGGAGFRTGGGRRRRGKKGRGAGARRRAAASSSRSAEEEMLAAMMGGMMGGMGGMFGAEPSAPSAPACPKGHTLKRRKADGVYECDACERDIAEGKRIFECKKCDFSLCQKCHKEAVGMTEAEKQELFEEFCDMVLKPTRQGGFKCELCGKVQSTRQAAQEHLLQKHQEELEARDAWHMSVGPRRV